MPLTVLSVAYTLAKVSPGTAGGAEQILLTLDRALIRCGHRSIVVSASHSRCQGLIVPVSIPSGEFGEAEKLQGCQSFKRALDRELKKHPVDVVHMHGLDFDQCLPDADVPVVVTLHLPLTWYRAQALQPRPNTALVCVSEAQACTAPPGVQVFRTIPNGIDLDQFHCVLPKSDYVLVLGRICPEKSVHLAIEATQQARVKILLAGAVFGYPEHQAYFQTMVQPKLGADVRFVGPIGGKRKAQLLAGAKCLLIPSQAPESSSLAAMESLASGTPVIAWRSGALGEIVRHGRTGFIVSSVEEMAEAIHRAREINPFVCRREAERRFSADRMVSEYLNLYRQVMRTDVAPDLLAA